MSYLNGLFLDLIDLFLFWLFCLSFIALYVAKRITSIALIWIWIELQPLNLVSSAYIMQIRHFIEVYP